MSDEYDSADDEPQALTLRQKAEALTKPPRERALPPDGFTPDGDRIVKPDSDGITRFEEEPRYKNESELYEARQTEREESEEQEFEDQRQYLTEDEERHKATVRDTVTWSSNEEKAAVSEYQGRMSQWQANASRQAALEQRGAAQVAALNQSGQHHAAQIVAREILQAREGLEAERSWLVQRAAQGERHNAAKETAALQQELARVAPGIMFTENRAAFKLWLQRECRIPLKDIERERDPQTIAAYWKSFQEHERGQVEKLARQRIAREVRTTRGAGSETSSADARKALRETGKPDSALQFLALRKSEKRYGL